MYIIWCIRTVRIDLESECTITIIIAVHNVYKALSQWCHQAIRIHRCVWPQGKGKGKDGKDGKDAGGGMGDAAMPSR